jgi:hypothetical protein
VVEQYHDVIVPVELSGSVPVVMCHVIPLSRDEVFNPSGLTLAHPGIQNLSHLVSSFSVVGHLGGCGGSTVFALYGINNKTWNTLCMCLMLLGSSNRRARPKFPTFSMIQNGPKVFQSSFLLGRTVVMCSDDNITKSPTLYPSVGTFRRLR